MPDLTPDDVLREMADDRCEAAQINEERDGVRWVGSGALARQLLAAREALRGLVQAVDNDGYVPTSHAAMDEARACLPEHQERSDA